MENNEKTEIIDNERLKWIAFFHYVSGGITIAFSLFFLIYVVIFGLIAFNPDIATQSQSDNPQQVRDVMRILFIVFASLSTFGIIYGICEIISGTFIKKRKYRIFSMVIAIPRVIYIPYGTILSIFTLIMLGKPTVQAQYENAKDVRKAMHSLDA